MQGIAKQDGWWRVDTKDGYTLFAYKKDAENYMDYLANGLKVVQQKDRTYRFNDGSMLIDVTPATGVAVRKFVLHKNNRTIVSEKLMKKYTELVL